MKGLKMSFENLANSEKKDPEIDQRINSILKQINRNDRSTFFAAKYFKNPDFFNSLPEAIKNSNEEIAAYIENVEKFSDVISAERQKRWAGEESLFGEEISIGESVHHDGRTRRAEKGYKIKIEYLKTLGIDPTKVLFFRLTQPSDTAKPEYYWTSDYFETRRGLTKENSSEDRASSVVLIASLETINQNEGLIQDINDDQGLAVRQIGSGDFDQKKALATVMPSR